MISRLELNKSPNGTYQIRAIRGRDDVQKRYAVVFEPAESSLNMGLTQKDVTWTYLDYDRDPNNPLLGSPNFEIARGLYDVYYAEFVQVENGWKVDNSTRVRYPDQIMAGEKYKIQYIKRNDISFGQLPGTRVKIRSSECDIDSHTMYYTIAREGLNKIKYYIPFNGGREIEFFVQGVDESEFKLSLGNESFELFTR